MVGLWIFNIRYKECDHPSRMVAFVVSRDILFFVEFMKTELIPKYNHPRGVGGIRNDKREISKRINGEMAFRE